jgi:hypothetical protein
MVVIAPQIGMKRRGAIARGKEEYFVFGAACKTAVIPRRALARTWNLEIPHSSLRDTPE